MKKTIVCILCAMLIVGMAVPVYAEETGIQQTDKNEWICPACGETASGNFCSNCGGKKPLNAGEWTCPECGAAVTGNFCNNCGAAKPADEGDNVVFVEDVTVGETKADANNGSVVFSEEVQTEIAEENESEAETQPETEPETEAAAQPETEPETQQETVTQPETEPETEAAAQPETETESEPPTDKQDQSDKPAAADVEEPNITETVLVDEQGILITAKEIDYSGYTPELKLLLENNTDGDVSFYSGTSSYSVNSVNSYMDSGYLNETVSAGKKANVKIRLDGDDMEFIGISRIAELQIGIYANDADGNEILRTEPIRIPTEIADSYDLSSESLIENLETSPILSSNGAELLFSYKDNFLGTELAELSSICAVKNKDGKIDMFVDVLNTSDELLYAGIKDIYVNDLLVCSDMWEIGTVTPGKHRVLSAVINNILDKNCWDAIGINSIDKITFTLILKDKDYNDIYYYADISLHPTANDPVFNTSGDEIYNEDGIRVIYSALIEDDFSYSDDFHLLLLVENTSGQDLNFDDESNTAAINGFMTYAYTMSTTIKNGAWGLLDVNYPDSYFENADIETLADVNNVEISFRVRDPETLDEIAIIPVSVDYQETIVIE